MSSKARPISTMPATTPATMGMMSGPAGHSEKEKMHRDRMKSSPVNINLPKMRIEKRSTRTSFNATDGKGKSHDVLLVSPVKTIFVI